MSFYLDTFTAVMDYCDSTYNYAGAKPFEYNYISDDLENSVPISQLSVRCSSNSSIGQSHFIRLEIDNSETKSDHYINNIATRSGRSVNSMSPTDSINSINSMSPTDSIRSINSINSMSPTDSIYVYGRCTNPVSPTYSSRSISSSFQSIDSYQTLVGKENSSFLDDESYQILTGKEEVNAIANATPGSSLDERDLDYENHSSRHFYRANYPNNNECSNVLAYGSSEEICQFARNIESNSNN